MARVVVKLGEKTERTLELDVDLLIVGRGSDAHVEIEHDLISRKHCRLRRAGDGFVVEDLESKTGTFVNGVKVGAHLLEPGDVVGVGPYSLVFEYSKADVGGAAPAAPPDQTAEDFWTNAAAESGVNNAVSSQSTAAADDMLAGNESAQAASSLTPRADGAADMDDYQGTMEASPEQVERLRQLLLIESRPHLSVKVKGEMQRVSVDDGDFTVGHFDGADFRLDGNKWFGKVQFRLRKIGDGSFRIDSGGFFASVQLNGKKLKGSQPLKNGARISAGGLKFRFKLGD